MPSVAHSTPFHTIPHQTALTELRATRKELGQALAHHASSEKQLKEAQEAALEEERDDFDIK